MPVAALPISMVVAPETEAVPISPPRVIFPAPAEALISMAAKSVSVAPPRLPTILTVPAPLLIVKLRAVESDLIVLEKSIFPPVEVIVTAFSRTTAPLISISVLTPPESVPVVVMSL